MEDTIKQKRRSTVRPALLDTDYGKGSWNKGGVVPTIVPDAQTLADAYAAFGIPPPRDPPRSRRMAVVGSDPDQAVRNADFPEDGDKKLGLTRYLFTDSANISNNPPTLEQWKQDHHAHAVRPSVNDGFDLAPRIEPAPEHDWSHDFTDQDADDADEHETLLDALDAELAATVSVSPSTPCSGRDDEPAEWEADAIESCSNCRRANAFTRGLCEPCYRYERRTGHSRPSWRWK